MCLQLDQKTNQLKLVQSALEEKRRDFLKLETELKGMEEKYYTSNASLKDKTLEDLRVFITFLDLFLFESQLHMYCGSVTSW